MWIWLLLQLPEAARTAAGQGAQGTESVQSVFCRSQASGESCQAELTENVTGTLVRIYIQHFGSIQIRIHKVTESGANADPVKKNF
jgi:hypothetical protein